MNANTVKTMYFNWMASLAIPNLVERSRYTQLLASLDSIKFYFTIPLDENRLIDGMDLRYRFGSENRFSRQEIGETIDTRECSMLEMMVALAIRCEEHIIYDPFESNAGTLFKEMLRSLKLTEMYGKNFDVRYVEQRIDCLLNHDYDRNGSGGLFTVDRPKQDMRTVEIWYQMCWYLDVVLAR